MYVLYFIIVSVCNVLLQLYSLLYGIAIIAPIYSKQREWEGWAHKPGVIHLNLACSRGPSVVLCVHYQ